MGRKKRYHNIHKKDADEQKREDKALRLMEEKQAFGRLPTPTPGYFHDTDDRPGRKDRSRTRRRLKDLTKKEFRNG